MADHRVPMLPDSLHRFSDPTRSRDPLVRGLITRLATVEIAPEPTDQFRSELRRQLVAVAPRLIAEGTPELIRHTPATLQRAAVTQEAPSALRTALGKLQHLRLSRGIGVAITAMTVLAVLLGGAVWLSNSALPGDPLYGLKRASESAQLSLTSGGTDRATELLSFAETRADEVSALLGQSTASAPGSGPQAAAGISSRTASLITSTLGSADDNVRQSSEILGSEAIMSQSVSPLHVMTGWAPAQLVRLQQITDRIPAGTLHDRAASSTQLVQRALTRSGQLRSLVNCSCMSQARSDNLGPVPCADCAAIDAKNQHAATTAVTTAPAAEHPSATTNKRSTPALVSPTHSAIAAIPTIPSAPVPTPATPTPTPTDGGISLPSLPITIPTLLPPSGSPLLTVGTCGIGLHVGQLGLQLGACATPTGTGH